jgi:hypothetical protein
MKKVSAKISFKNSYFEYYIKADTIKTHLAQKPFCACQSWPIKLKFRLLFGKSYRKYGSGPAIKRQMYCTAMTPL